MSLLFNFIPIVLAIAVEFWAIKSKRLAFGLAWVPCSIGPAIAGFYLDRWYIHNFAHLTQMQENVASLYSVAFAQISMIISIIATVTIFGKGFRRLRKKRGS
jgi:hypothetical protein